MCYIRTREGSGHSKKQCFNHVALEKGVGTAVFESRRCLQMVVGLYVRSVEEISSAVVHKLHLDRSERVR
jgi:hypothetical protein